MREKNNGKLMKIIYMKKQEKKMMKKKKKKILNKNTLKIKKIKKTTKSKCLSFYFFLLVTYSFLFV